MTYNFGNKGITAQLNYSNNIDKGVLVTCINYAIMNYITYITL